MILKQITPCKVFAKVWTFRDGHVILFCLTSGVSSHKYIKKLQKKFLNYLGDNMLCNTVTPCTLHFVWSV